MKKTIIMLSLLLSIAFTQRAQTPQQDFVTNVKKSASNYYAYPDTDLPKLTAAPEGYVPFYIDHYGRHGSRWLISPKQYGVPMEQLGKAARHNKLTARGKEVLAVLQSLDKASKNRLGELSDIGADQHRRIARRMYANFPEAFKDSATVDAKSTVVIRCILSMENELQELKALNPKLKISHDASMADMYYMNYSDSVATKIRKKAKKELKAFCDRHNNPEYMLSKLINDKKFARDSIDGKELATNLFDVAGNMQSHYQFENVSLYDIFSADEIYDLWQCKNATWYVNACNSPLTKQRMPYSQKNLLRNMIASADSVMASGGHGATLRFGHEAMLLPLACLMELDDCNKKVDDLEGLGQVWQNYKIFPMGCNIQMVFYRKAGSDDVLVKVLLNEHEARLPIVSATAPYYNWNDVRTYYVNKLDKQAD